MIDLLKWEAAINHAWEEKKPCIVVSADRNGYPDVSFKGSTMVFDGDHLAWWERTRGELIEQVQQNPHVVVFYRDENLILRFYGDATVHTEGPTRGEIMERTIPQELAKDPERKGYGVMVRIDRVRQGSNTIQERDGGG